VFVSFSGCNSCCVRDAIQSHWRVRVVDRVYFVIESKKNRGPLNVTNQYKLEQELIQLMELRKKFKEIEITETWGDEEKDHWGNNLRDNIQSPKVFAELNSDLLSFQKYSQAKAFPQWFRAIYFENIIEDNRTCSLTHVEVMSYLIDKCGYRIEWVDVNERECEKVDTIAFSYNDIPEVVDIKLLQKSGKDHDSLTTIEVAMLKKYYFDNHWIESNHEVIWNDYLSQQYDASIDSILNYTHHPSSASIFYQVLREMQNRDSLYNNVSMSPLDFTKFEERLYYAKSVCKILKLKHSQDTTAKISEETIAMAIETIPISVYDLWPKQRVGKLDETPFQQLKHFFRCWSGMKLQHFLKSHKKTSKITLVLKPIEIEFANDIRTPKHIPLPILCATQMTPA
jgi:hypothetical protein